MEIQGVDRSSISPRVCPQSYFYGTCSRFFNCELLGLYHDFYHRGRLTPAPCDNAVPMRCADSKQRTHSPRTVGARTVPTRATLHRRAGIVPRRHHQLGAHRRSPLELLVQPYLHTRSPWPLITTNTQNSPASTSPPPTTPAPPRIAAAAPRRSRRRRHGGRWQLYTPDALAETRPEAASMATCTAESIAVFSCLRSSVI